MNGSLKWNKEQPKKGVIFSRDDAVRCSAYRGLRRECAGGGLVARPAELVALNTFAADRSRATRNDEALRTNGHCGIPGKISASSMPAPKK